MSPITDRSAIPALLDPMDELDATSSFDSSSESYESLRPRPRRVILEHRPSLNPTIAPLGAERRIAVCHMGEGTICVRGKVTGREYVFAPGERRDIPISDARHLVTEQNFAFVGGR